MLSTLLINPSYVVEGAVEGTGVGTVELTFVGTSA
jgi:hypothetical protein